MLDSLAAYAQEPEAILNGIAIKVLNFGPNPKHLSVKEIVEIATYVWPPNTVVEFPKDSNEEGVEAKELPIN